MNSRRNVAARNKQFGTPKTTGLEDQIKAREKGNTKEVQKLRNHRIKNVRFRRLPKGGCSEAGKQAREDL
jgi:hypothetical protein